MKAYLMPLLAAALLSPVAAASEQLSLARAVAAALQHNGELAVLRQQAAALEGRAEQAGASPNPALEYLREGRLEQGGASALQLAIPLELGGKRGARVAAARAELQVAVADLAAARLRVQADVVAAFHEAYLAEQRLALASRTSASAQQSTRSAAARVVAGKISPVEETRAQLAEANWQLEAIAARRDLGAARIKLALLSGTEAATLPPLAAPEFALPAAPGQQAILARLAETPLARRAADELAWRSAAARLERSRRYPDLTLIVGKKHEGVARERQTIVGLSVPLPLFDRNQGAIREADSRIAQARAEMAAGRLRLQADALQAAGRLEAALEQERFIRAQVLPNGQSAFAAASKGFEAGKFSVLEVLDAQRSYFQAQVQHLRAVSEAHRAAADLATLIGPLDAAHPTISTQDTP